MNYSRINTYKGALKEYLPIIEFLHSIKVSPRHIGEALYKLGARSEWSFPESSDTQQINTMAATCRYILGYRKIIPRRNGLRG